MTSYEGSDREELGGYSVDDEDQLQEEDTLVDRGVDDVLDEGYSPPERPLGAESFGTTAAEQERGETIEQRITEEVPDPDSAYGAPDDESGLEQDRLGGDDPDTITADEDFLGDPEVGDQRSGRLMAPDEGAHEDEDPELYAQDEGFSGGAASAEEAAMHTVDGDPEASGED